MKAVPLSEMRYRVTIQAPQEPERDSRGGFERLYDDVATVWAKVEPLSGREAWQAQQAQADVSHRITIRYYAGLTPRHRLTLGGRVFNIESALDVENRHREHQVMCKEEV